MPTRCSISQIYFGKELYMFRTDLLPIIRSLNTVYTAIGVRPWPSHNLKAVRPWNWHILQTYHYWYNH